LRKEAMSFGRVIVGRPLRTRMLASRSNEVGGVYGTGNNMGQLCQPNGVGGGNSVNSSDSASGGAHRTRPSLLDHPTSIRYTLLRATPSLRAMCIGLMPVECIV